MITDTQERILEIFKKYKTSLNGFLKEQVISLEVQKWDRINMDGANNAIRELIQLEYISHDGDYWLLDKGYDYIYRNYSIKDTEELILNEIRKHKVGVGHFIMDNWFLNMRQNAERYHFDNMNTAFENLINSGVMTVAPDGRGYFLTQSGYSRIY